jgi:hypothetical protein
MKWGDKLTEEFFPEKKYREYFKHKCDRCLKKDVQCRHIENPYEFNMNEDKTKKWLCDSCYNFLLDEI